MSNYQSILEKLNSFIKKYYSKMLVKGVLLFLSFGVFFFLVTLSIEYFLWLSSTGRLILLVVFVCFEVVLAYKYIAIPLFYLFRMKKGISNKQAAIIIGNHFPNVGDKLLNLLDLSDDAVQSELLMASINQRSASLDGFSFTKAVDLKENRKYAKYALIPLVLIGVIWISGDIKSFFGSYNRMVNYDLAYEPPAPFAFRLLSTDLEVLETDSFTVEVTTEGSVRPEQN